MNDCLVVCSEHSLPEDFGDTRPNQQRVKSGAVPTKMATVIQEELKVCRVCLAVDVKMHNMKDFGLSEMFKNITGISAIDKTASSLQRVCWECTARLTAAAAFREDALLSDALLKNQVHFKESDIAILKQNYSSLKSTLSVVSAFTSSIIERERSISKNNEIDNNILNANDETVTKERKPKVTFQEKEIQFKKYGALKDIPVKKEVESDRIADNNMRCQDRKRFNDTSPTEDSEDEMTNTEVHINTNDNILSEDTQIEVPVINDSNLMFVNYDYNEEKKPKLDEIGNIVGESSSEEDTHSYSETVSVIKSEQKMSSKVGTTKGRATIRINDSLKRKIIALKKKAVPVRDIAKETGISVSNIYGIWSRYNRAVKKQHRPYTQRREQTEIESDSEQNNSDNEAGKEKWPCSSIVKQRLRQAGLQYILKKKPVRPENMGQKISMRKALHDNFKQLIIALKQEGISMARTAYLLNTTPTTVRKWWVRWNKEGHMNNLKAPPKKRKTTALEDRLLIERVTQEQTVHTPTLAKEFGVSTDSVRRRLKEAGFQFKEQKASVPLRSGRSHKIDEATKQQIISMKHSGVSVTEIANQFQVTRTSVYLWWRQWCKENNIKIKSARNTSKTAEQEQSAAEDTNVEKIVQTPSVLSSQKTSWQKIPDL